MSRTVNFDQKWPYGANGKILIIYTHICVYISKWLMINLYNEHTSICAWGLYADGQQLFTKSSQTLSGETS
jgi:hypothetical protein